jgi:hypothetical protein
VDFAPDVISALRKWNDKGTEINQIQLLEKFASQLSSSNLTLIPMNPLMPPRLCHHNVSWMVQHHGGKQIIGWTFSVNKLIPICGAIWHSVWEDPEGTLVDITERTEDAMTNGAPCGEGNRLYFLKHEQQNRIRGYNKFFPLTRSQHFTRKVRKINQLFWQGRDAEAVNYYMELFHGCDAHEAMTTNLSLAY